MFFFNKLNVSQINCQNNFLHTFKIPIKPNSTSYICTSCLHNINENKPPLYQEPNKFFKTKSFH